MISGIRRDTDDTQDDGAVLVVNARFAVDGECRLRLGMERFSDTDGLSIYRFWHPISGAQAILVTSTGDLEAVAL